MSTNQQIIDQAEPAVERSPFRQRLAEAERGFTACFRANSSMFLYFFTTSIALSIAIVIGLNGLQWAILTLAITTALSSEVLHFSIHNIVKDTSESLPDNIRQLLKMATASCMLLLAGSIMSIVILLSSRCCELYM